MKKESIVLGGGCFWCLEAIYQRVKGVTKVTNGYAGGGIDNPSYELVASCETGHAEVVKVEFDPKIIDVKTILTLFWTLHDPTTLNRQGADTGPQYRSVLLYSGEGQKTAALQTKEEVAEKIWKNKIVTEIKPLDVFWPAEAYHQNYFKQHPEQAYCQLIINPKVVKLKQKFSHLLK